MKIKQMLIISLFLIILVSITVGVSYAVSSEKIDVPYYSKMTQTFDKKIVSIDRIETLDKKGNSKYAYKINIKKAHQNKYKIQSVKCLYDAYSSKIHDYDLFEKTYDGKNKTTLTIKPPAYIYSMTINYHTKEKTKKESTKFNEKSKVAYDYERVGKKAKIIIKEKGYDSSKTQGALINYQKFQIKTLNKKYKINTIKAIYHEMDGKVYKTLTFKGNRKTTFTKTMKEKVKGRGLGLGLLGAFQITYY